MYPDRATAFRELELAGTLNPGPWTAHSQNVALAAECIAKHCPSMDSEKAFVCGLMHDIGRRTGIFALRHVIDGYDYAMSKGWDEIARICLTHSYPVQDIRANIAKTDITEDQYRFLDDFLQRIEYDDYDKLIILCDALGEANGLCILEKRLIDTTRRYGVSPSTVERWNRTYAYKEYFESIIGQSIYFVLPGIEQCIYT